MDVPFAVFLFHPFEVFRNHHSSRGDVPTVNLYTAARRRVVYRIETKRSFRPPRGKFADGVLENLEIINNTAGVSASTTATTIGAYLSVCSPSSFYPLKLHSFSSELCPGSNVFVRYRLIYNITERNPKFAGE